MQDRPTREELLTAVQQFLEDDVLPALDGPKKFHARVAANLLAIVQRELESDETQLQAEWQRLDGLLGPAPQPGDRAHLRQALRERTAELVRRIRQGDADRGAWRADVVEHVRQTVEEKLAVTNPKMLERQHRSPSTRRTG